MTIKSKDILKVVYERIKKNILEDKYNASSTYEKIKEILEYNNTKLNKIMEGMNLTSVEINNHSSIKLNNKMIDLLQNIKFFDKFENYLVKYKQLELNSLKSIWNENTFSIDDELTRNLIEENNNFN